MLTTMLAAAVAAIVRSLAALRLERWQLGAPAVMVLAGIAAGLGVESSAATVFNTEVAQHVAEIILAVLLFVDATEIRGGRLWGNSPRLVARMLLLAMPLSMGAAVLLGAVLFPELSWAMLLVLACVVVPVDFAPNEKTVRDRRIPARIRSVLNVEGGYNDGIVSPIFLFALLLAGSTTRAAEDPLDALAEAVPVAVKAIVVGLVLGALLGWLLDRSEKVGWTTDQSRRIAVLLLPVSAYATAVAIEGNGFVAAFVSGIAFRFLHRYLVARRLHRRPAAQRGNAPVALTRDFGLIEDVTMLLTMTMWFVVGMAAVITIKLGIDWQTVLFCVLALTAVRVVPVLMALVRTSLPWRRRLLLGALGPRGTTTIVFGLLAYNGLPDGVPAETVLACTVLCVLGSVFLHGIGSSAVIHRLTDRPAPTAPAEQGAPGAERSS